MVALDVWLQRGGIAHQPKFFVAPFSSCYLPYLYFLINYLFLLLFNYILLYYLYCNWERGKLMPALINMDKSKFRRGISKKLTETESISFYVHYGR
jgi:hypothetical protein